MLTYQDSITKTRVHHHQLSIGHQPVVTSEIEFKQKKLDLTRNAVVSNAGIELVSCWTLPQYVSFKESKCQNSDHLVLAYNDHSKQWKGYNELLETDLVESAVNLLFTNLIEQLPTYGKNIRLKKFLSLFFLAQSSEKTETVRLINDSLIKFLVEQYVPYIVNNKGENDQDTFLVRYTCITILVVLKKIFGLTIHFHQVYDLLHSSDQCLELHIELTSDFMEDLFYQLLTTPLYGHNPNDQKMVYKYIIRESIGPKLINLAYRIYDIRNEQYVQEVIKMMFFGKN